MTTVAALLTMALVGAPAESGAARRFYTGPKVQTMRSNLRSCEWAQKKRGEIIALADKWAAYDDDRLRSLVVPPQVPRCYDLHNHGCPIHGTRVYDQGLYRWIIDFDRPFKVRCPVGGEEYPSNDFAAYLASGMKDRSLLTGDYADDGWGWHKPDDPTPANYWFVAYYAHWSMMNFLREAINNLSLAALLTEDDARARVYAHKCALLLWQLAEYYPDYDYAKQSREGKEHNPNYQGKLYNFIWEVATPNDCAPAYDAVRPFLAADTRLHNITGRTADQIDHTIRERLLMEAARRITDGSGMIGGNYGRAQRALLTLALVLDEKESRPTSKEMIRWVADNPNPRGLWDIGLRDALLNLVYRDGVPPESLNYNLGWNQELTEVAEMLAECGENVFDDPRFRKLLNWPFEVYLAGAFTPSLGDTGDMFSRGGQWTSELYGKALRHISDARYAWVVRRSGISNPDLFSEPLEKILSAFESQPEPVIGCSSTLLPAYGLANLQCGSQANRTAVCLSYSAHPQHAHADQLNLMLFSHDNALLTDIGYPEQTDAFNHRLAGYFTNTIAHNTVTVDASRQRRGPGTLHAFSTHGFAQVADASCELAYPGTVSLYRRADILVRVSPEKSYTFDVFYVRGGRQHDFALHPTQADFSCDPGLGPVQAEGTLAGPDVPYEQFYDDPELKDKPAGSVRYTGYRGSGFQFLTNVRRANLGGHAVCDWKLTEPLKGQPQREWKGIGLRAHFLGADEELIACDGPVQRYAHMPGSVHRVIRRRAGENLRSCFVSVFEPYRGKPWISRVSRVKVQPDDGDAAAGLVELADGSRHYLFHSICPEREYVLDGGVRVSGQAACLVLDASGKPEKAVLVNGTSLRFGSFKLNGNGIRRTRIKSVDYASGIVEVADPILGENIKPGSVVLIRGNGFTDSVTVRSVLDAARFSIGDEDLRVAGGPILELVGSEIVTSVPTRYAVPGMTVLNGRLEPKGRLEKKGERGWFITGGQPPSWDDFPRTSADSNPRYYVAAAGPGDELLIPDCVVTE